MKVVTLDENSKQNLLDELLKRSPNHYGEFPNGSTPSSKM